MTVSKRAERKGYWRAWAGDVASLRRLAAVLDEARQDHPKKADLRVVARLDKGSASRDEGSEVLEGDVDEVLNKIDRRRVEELALSLVDPDRPYAEPLAMIRLQPKHFFGATLEVRSDRPEWTRSWFSALAEDIGLGSPKWGWFRSPIGSLTLSLIVFLITFSSILVGFGRFDKFTTTTILIAGGIATLLATVAQIPLVGKWLFPAFEITGPNGHSNGSRRIVALILVIVQIPIGLIVKAVWP